MAVRNLARTVVEGGRGTWSKYDRRRLARISRRNWLVDEDGEPYKRYAPPRDSPEFADKLKPFYRWLESRCGRRWDDVYSELCHKNNRDTMKGWHLRSHLQQYVCCNGLEKSNPYPRWGSGPQHDEFCAADGILRRTPRIIYKYSQRPSEAARAQAHAWAAGRKVVVQGPTLFWTSGVWIEPLAYDPLRPWLSAGFRSMAQGKRFTAVDVEMWRRIGSTLRDELTYRSVRVLRRQASGVGKISS